MTTLRTTLLLLASALAACGGGPGGPPANGNDVHGDEPTERPLEVLIEEVPDPGEDELVQVEARLVMAGVARRRQGDHGALPEIAREAEEQPDAWPKVMVRNDTQHGLVVWFAGPCPRTVALLPQGEHTVELCEGSYDIAAQLSAADFLPFVGEGDELENGYGYALSFYVIAEPRTRVLQRRR